MGNIDKHLTAPSEVFFCMGTRPEIIKLAPVIQALRSLNVTARIVNSGQHEPGITTPLYDFFNLRPDVQLSIVRGGELGIMNGRLLAAYTELFAARRPAAVVVQGDTSSAWQAAQAAFLMHIPVAHVEAGLRTHDLLRPFPEELNRTLISRVARWHFAPTQRAAEALASEGVPGLIQVVGNTVVDAALWGVGQVSTCAPAGINASMKALFESKRTILVTAHRRENWGAGIASITTVLSQALMNHEDLACVWVLHPNPAVAESVSGAFSKMRSEVKSRLRLVSPQGYAEMLWMMKHAWTLLTDSGGIQEEAVTLGLPVLVARDETERPEVLECGNGKLVGTDASRIRKALESLYVDEALHARMSLVKSNPFGDGQSAVRIAAQIAADMTGKELAHEHVPACFA